MPKLKTVRFPKKLMKELGLSMGKEGLLIEKQKLTDIKKFQSKPADELVKEPKKSFSVGKTSEEQRAEDKGVY